jgi:hypothetical protein
MASDEAGRPIFKEFDFVRIMIPGDNLTEIDTYAQESHKQRFPRQWAHYQNQVASHEDIIGTLLEQWPQITRSQADELRGLKFHTVESIADCSDQQQKCNFGNRYFGTCFRASRIGDRKLEE